MKEMPEGASHQLRRLEVLLLFVGSGDCGGAWARVVADAWVAEPGGAACLEALSYLQERGMVKRAERVVAVNTGSAEKYLPVLRHLLC